MISFLRWHLTALWCAAGKSVTRTVFKPIQLEQRVLFLNSASISEGLCVQICAMNLCWWNTSCLSLTPPLRRLYFVFWLYHNPSCPEALWSLRAVLRLDRLKCTFMDATLTKFCFSCKNDCLQECGCAVLVRELAYMFICISVYGTCSWFSVVYNDCNLDFGWKQEMLWPRKWHTYWIFSSNEWWKVHLYFGTHAFHILYRQKHS